MSDAAMVYDSARARMLLFGAFNLFGLMLPETWEYDGTSWIQEHPATSPSPRTGPGLAFDSSPGRAVLFGAPDPNIGRVADTWAWDRATWTQVATSAAQSAGFWHPTPYDPAGRDTGECGGVHVR